MMLFSCGDEDPADDNNGNDNKNKEEEPITPVEPGKKESLTPSQQKERMQNISKEFMNQVPAYDFEDIADLYMYAADEYEDYDWDGVEEWAEDIYDATLKATGNQYKETEKEYGYTYNYFYTEYTNLILASNFTGHFTANRGNVKASATLNMKKQQTTLLSLAFADDLKDIPSCNVSAFSRETFDIDDYDTDKTTAKNTFVKLDVMGKMQIQGSITDLHKYADYLEKADASSTSTSPISIAATPWP